MTSESEVLQGPVRRLLFAQAGVITTAQTRGLGLPGPALTRLVRDERWSRPVRGVYLRGIGDPTFEQWLWIGHLLAGEPSAIGGQAALHRYGIGDPPDQITVFVPPLPERVLPLRFEVVRDGRGRLAHARGTLPLIRIDDALLDLSVGHSIEDFVGRVTDAVRLNRTTAKRVESVLRLRERHPRKAELLEVLADLQGIESNLEFVFRRDVERAHGLPTATRQVRRRRSRFDAVYEEFAVVAEVDGSRGHVDKRFRDYRRDNEHAVDLVTTLRYGTYDIRDEPCGIAFQLASALRVRGWTGQFNRCSRCPLGFAA